VIYGVCVVLFAVLCCVLSIMYRCVVSGALCAVILLCLPQVCCELYRVSCEYYCDQCRRIVCCFLPAGFCVLCCWVICAVLFALYVHLVLGVVFCVPCLLRVVGCMLSVVHWVCCVVCVVFWAPLVMSCVLGVVTKSEVSCAMHRTVCCVWFAECCGLCVCESVCV